VVASRDLLVRIIGDSKDVEAAFARSNRAANTFGSNVDTTAKKADRAAKSFRGLATGAAAGFGGAVVFNEVAQQLNTAISVASNLNEQISRTNVVFGQSADAVVDWSKTTAKSIGVAQDQALDAAGTFGAMFDQAGQASADAARLSEDVVQLAADLASFNNSSIDESLTALRSGLSGEIEPLRRFQVFLTEASVAQEAMAQSGKKSAKELTQGEKIMARWSLILKQTSKQQGDFVRTSDGLANSQRILQAQTRDLQAAVGSGLLPIMESFTGVLVTATGEALELADALRVLANIKIPTIEIPFTTKEVGGGTVGGAAGKVAGIAILGQISPAGLLAVGIKEAVDRIRGEEPNAGDIKNLAKAFDDQFGAFTDQTFTEINKSVDKANKKIAAFGQKGFKPLDVNPLGEALQRQFDQTVGALDLEFDKAVFAGNDAAAFAALDQLEAAIRKRIASQGETNELMRQLFVVEQQRTAIIKQNKDEAKRAADEAKELAREQARAAREQAKALEQQRQFRAIGLSPEGTDPTPTVENLRKQFDSLSKNVIGQNVSSKLLSRLKAVGNALSGGIKDMKEPTRAAIRDLFDAIRAEFDKGTKTGPLTKTTGLNANKVLEGLGLSPEQEREARARLSSFNSAGRSLAGNRRPTGSFTGGAPITVEVHNTTTLDGETVGRNVTRTQQKQKRRNPKQKRGPRSGV
jgi:hypothetical protein